ncbi:MAG: hypothetical protein ACOYN0_15755 [Phycisphaerales bacterium]
MFLAQNSPSWLNAGTLKLAFWAIVIIGIAVSKIVKAAKEQAEVRRQMDVAKRAADEALRTGRPVPGEIPPAPIAARQRPALASSDGAPKSAAQRLEELAAQRRAQIEELRRQRATAAQASPHTSTPQPQLQAEQRPQMVGARVTPPAPPARSVMQAPAPAAPPFAKSQMSRPNTAATRAQANRPPQAQPKGKQAQQSAKQPQRGQPAPKPAARPAPAPATDHHYGESSTHRLVPDTPAATNEVHAPSVGGFSIRPGDWKRAFIFQELLAPPMAMRDE